MKQVSLEALGQLGDYGPDLHSRQKALEVGNALKSLSRLEKEVVMRLYMQGYTYEEVARATGLSRGEVECREKEALSKLEDVIAGD